MLRQQVVFSEEYRKIKGCGILKEDFHTKFRSKKWGSGSVTWWKSKE